jgi:hypothetical protein
MSEHWPTDGEFATIIDLVTNLASIVAVCAVVASATRNPRGRFPLRPLLAVGLPTRERLRQFTTNHTNCTNDRLPIIAMVAIDFFSYSFDSCHSW